MYEDLIKRLRNVSMYFGQLDHVSVLLLEAADAIEVLSKKEKTTKPHGRLIDADALKEQLEYVASLEWNQRVGASPGIECAIDMLDDAQTVIPAEEGE
jgi:hypothetical protein